MSIDEDDIFKRKIRIYCVYCVVGIAFIAFIITIILSSLVSQSVIIAALIVFVITIVIGLIIALPQSIRIRTYNSYKYIIETVSKNHDIKGFIGKNFFVLKIEGYYYVYYGSYDLLFILSIKEKDPIPASLDKNMKKPVIGGKKLRKEGEFLGNVANCAIYKHEGDVKFIDPSDNKWYKGRAIIFILIIPKLLGAPVPGRRNVVIREPGIIFHEDKFSEIMDFVKKNTN